MAIEVTPDYDPASTLELGGLGGATIADASLEQIASDSELLVKVRVIDVMASRLHTADGTLRTADVLNDRDARRPFPITDVELEVVEVLAGNSTVDLAPGTRLGITIVGGVVGFTINDRELASQLGYLEVVVPESSVNHPDPISGVLQRQPNGEEIEVAVTGPVTGYIGLEPTENFTEGEILTVFLTHRSIPGQVGWSIDALTPTHPYGVLRASGPGTLVDEFGGTISRPQLDSVISLVAAN